MVNSESHLNAHHRMQPVSDIQRNTSPEWTQVQSLHFYWTFKKNARVFGLSIGYVMHCTEAMRQSTVAVLIRDLRNQVVAPSNLLTFRYWKISIRVDSKCQGKIIEVIQKQKEFFEIFEMNTLYRQEYTINTLLPGVHDKLIYY